MTSIPMVRLEKVLTLSDNAVSSASLNEINLAGVYSFGRGLFKRGPLLATETMYKSYNCLVTDEFVISQPKAWEGAIARVTEEFDGWYLSPVFPTFRLDKERVDPRYLEWFCKRAPVWVELQRKSRGIGARRESVSPNQFLSVEIPLPSLPEQRRIVARIESLIAKIEEAQAIRKVSVEEADSLEAAASNDFFAQRAGGNCPTVPLGEIAEIRSGVTFGRILRGPTVRLPYLRVANVQDGHLNLSHVKEVEILETEVAKWLLKSGDVLMTEGGDWDKLGRGTVWMGEIANCIHQNHIFRVRTNPLHFNPEYLAVLIGSPYGKSYFQEASKQTTNLASINQKQLKAFRIFNILLKQQRRIVAYLDGLQAKVDALKKLQSDTTGELAALMPSILNKAFKGEL